LKLDRRADEHSSNATAQQQDPKRAKDPVLDFIYNVCVRS